LYENLTQRQIDILDYIKKEISLKGYPPSVREIGEAVGLSSSSTVHGHLTTLEEKGYLRRNPAKPRAMEVIDSSFSYKRTKEMLDIPILGRVTAGQPILAVENIEDVFPVPQSFINSNKSLFMLTVQGESMIEAGIHDGDYLIVEQTSRAKNGDIVVALLDDEATVKRFFQEKDWVRLQPENRFMEPIIVKDIRILGRVIGLFRKM